MKNATMTDTCKRCNGTGVHAYHPIHGTTCFACGGRAGNRLGKFSVVIFDGPINRGGAALYSLVKLYPTKRHAMAATTLPNFDVVRV